MTKKLSRRTFLKKAIGGTLAILGTGSGGYFYSRSIEPTMLDISRHSIKHKAIPSGFDGLKIVQFSDTHLGFQYNLAQFKELMGEINSLDPDIIFFTGDLIDNPNEFKYANQITGALKKLTAPLGKFAVYGNHDHGGYGTDLYRKTMDDSGFAVLLNESRQVKLLDGSSIWIIGIDDAMLGKPDIGLAMASVPDDAFKILLSHAPDLATDASIFPIQLQLSGHSHGGQIQLPFIGPLVTPPHAEKYVEGFYSVGKTDSLTLYVNRGLGTTRLPFRFLSMPEVTVFTLQKTV
ncbi:metallophosphoesterase [Bacillus sp. T33-2]|uniref:metallophosphoesterase n=1 Tax=Bacillus sp. T33-2 TaxID=2054168 RepID=UPI000C77FAF3|nr:metallophosphoesterase [Bacillus sp. T33-2]PLR97470.1 metallophosphoesterase [Bacillus sp. T33-2]